MDEAGHLPSKNEIPEESSIVADRSSHSLADALKPGSSSSVPSSPHMSAMGFRAVPPAHSQNLAGSHSGLADPAGQAPVQPQMQAPPPLTRSWYERRSAAALQSRVETVTIDASESKTPFPLSSSESNASPPITPKPAADGLPEEKTESGQLEEKAAPVKEPGWAQNPGPPAPSAQIILAENKIGYGGATPDGRDHPFGLAGRMLDGMSRGTLSDWTDKTISTPVQDGNAGNGTHTNTGEAHDDGWASVLGQKFQGQQAPQKTPAASESTLKSGGPRARGLKSRDEENNPSGAFIGAIKSFRRRTDKVVLLRTLLSSNASHGRIKKSFALVDKKVSDENKITQPNVASISPTVESREATPGRLKSRPSVKMHLPDGTYGGGRTSIRGDGRGGVPRYDVALPKYDFPAKKSASKDSGVQITVDGANRRPRKAIDELESTAEMEKDKPLSPQSKSERGSAPARELFREAAADYDKGQASEEDSEKSIPSDPYTYIVQPGDTIESIARTVLQDPFLAALLFSLNRRYVLPEEQYGVHPLMVGVAIKLPTPAEILKYMKAR